MKIFEVLVSKEMLRCELIESYHVIYEETEMTEFTNNEHDFLVEKKRFVERTLTILKGNTQSTLQRVKTYRTECKNARDIRTIIYNDYPEIFKTIQIAKQAV
ncbi:hypothetical protein SAMN05192533_101444 [Mesobacillus persicus]|uniref:Uncharacterized protein n=1 Tax=Mesobacillus persicus TaxID=930146 RepID=A0A1H7WIM2_9BACI|nr:hypothetical protein [Mesobacillus persicus]SEM21436.1 hypothetical protein SAMN05192533_101444 [Mesobacillus persicus]